MRFLVATDPTPSVVKCARSLSCVHAFKPNAAKRSHPNEVLILQRMYRCARKDGHSHVWSVSFGVENGVNGATAAPGHCYRGAKTQKYLSCRGKLADAATASTHTRCSLHLGASRLLPYNEQHLASLAGKFFEPSGGWAHELHLLLSGVRATPFTVVVYWHITSRALCFPSYRRFHDIHDTGFKNPT